MVRCTAMMCNFSGFMTSIRVDKKFNEKLAGVYWRTAVPMYVCTVIQIALAGFEQPHNGAEFTDRNLITLSGRTDDRDSEKSKLHLVGWLCVCVCEFMNVHLHY